MRDELVKLLLHDLHKVMRKTFKGLKKEFNQELEVLFMLEHHPTMHMKFFAKNLNLSMPNMSKLMNKLEEDGLIERTTDPSDRRKVKLEITEIGKDQMQRQKELIHQLVLKRVEVLTDDEVSLLHDSLTNMINILGKVELDD